jgi:hypothetical protein
MMKPERMRPEAMRSWVRGCVLWAEITARLSDEGYGVISTGTIRSWKTRHQWSLPDHPCNGCSDAGIV